MMAGFDVVVGVFAVVADSEQSMASLEQMVVE